MPEQKLWVPLENNPEVMNSLARQLGMDDKLEFQDIISFDPEELEFTTRPCHALLVIIPMTETWNEARRREDLDKPSNYVDNHDPVLWFKQTIGNACGSIGLLHCLLNGKARDHILPGSTLQQIYDEARPKTRMEDRAKVLEDNVCFELAHKEAATLGDTVPDEPSGNHLGQHFVAFVKGDDGNLWELEGGRKGPIFRGTLRPEDDLLSPAAREMSMGRLMRLESEAGGGT